MHCVVFLLYLLPLLPVSLFAAGSDAPPSLTPNPFLLVLLLLQRRRRRRRVPYDISQSCLRSPAAIAGPNLSPRRLHQPAASHFLLQPLASLLSFTSVFTSGFRQQRRPSGLESAPRRGPLWIARLIKHGLVSFFFGSPRSFLSAAPTAAELHLDFRLIIIYHRDFQRGHTLTFHTRRNLFFPQAFDRTSVFACSSLGMFVCFPCLTNMPASCAQSRFPPSLAIYAAALPCDYSLVNAWCCSPGGVAEYVHHALLPVATIEGGLIVAPSASRERARTATEELQPRNLDFSACGRRPCLPASADHKRWSCSCRFMVPSRSKPPCGAAGNFHACCGR